MMKAILAGALTAKIVVSLLPLGGAVTTAATATPGKALNVVYQRTVPATVRRHQPRGAQSCFYGTFQLQPASPRLALHLYKRRRRGQDSDDYTVDLFDIGTAPGHAMLRLLRSFSWSDARSWAPTDFAASAYWLDPLRRRQPLLLLNCFARGECYGHFGDKIVAVFPDGWNGRVVTRRLAYDEGAGCGAVTETHAGLHAALDDQGRVQCYTSVWTPPEGPEQKTLLRWNGHEFAPVTPVSTPASQSAKR